MTAHCALQQGGGWERRHCSVSSLCHPSLPANRPRASPPSQETSDHDPGWGWLASECGQGTVALRPKAWSGCPVIQKTCNDVSGKWHEKGQLGSQCVWTPPCSPLLSVELVWYQEQRVFIPFHEGVWQQGHHVTQPGRADLGSSVS